MSAAERVTVTLPESVVRDIDRLEKNRSKFIHEAVHQELLRRRRENLLQSINNPHPDSGELAEAGFDEWASSLIDENPSDLVDLNTGKQVAWTPSQGWREVTK